MISLFILSVSFIVLLWGSSHLIKGTSMLASYYRLPPLLLGMLILGIGTSLPEIFFAINASYLNLNDLAIGNAIGSNIANIGLVLGLCIVLKPVKIYSPLLKREYPLLFLMMLLTFGLIIDGMLSVADGCLLLLGFICSFGYLLYYYSKDVISIEFKHFFNNKSKSIKLGYFHIFLGIIALPFSAYFLVKSTASVAHLLGLSQLVISLTIVAIGTSMPELVTSLMAIYKGYDDIALGTILGSNICNILVVLAIPGLLNTANINPILLWRELPILGLVTLILLLIVYNHKKVNARWLGGILLLIYISYIFSIIWDAM